MQDEKFTHLRNSMLLLSSVKFLDMTADVRFKKEKNEVLWGTEVARFILMKKKCRHLAALLL